ncbi:MAG: peptide ABC transporter substrate-binding protein [Deltaproteobacteria bacterium]|nr:peptide ABC transporter substrate-binding protein [Deltaproteobacteria bacterium]
MRRRAEVLWIAATLFLTVIGLHRADALTRVSIGVTETMETFNPYGDSVSLLYGIWCQVMGCLGTYDFDKGDYEGMLAERWEVKDPNTWIFHLRKNAKFHDGTPLTAADVVHSFNRIRTDPQSKQKQNIAPIASAAAIDNHTVGFVTKQPTAPLVEYLFDRFIVTSKAIYDKHGPDVSDRKYPVGAGPYKFKELLPGQRFVITKNLDYPGMREKKQAPDELIFRIMREPEQRVTALLNGEIQIAQFIPPHLRERVEKTANTKIVATDSVEIMFLAMSPKSKPWDNKLLRQAVCYAIDRDTIISTLLRGEATRLDGPIGPGQYGYNPNLKPKYEYNPGKAKQLVKQAGFPSGVDVDYYTPVGRYTLDKQISEAIVPMLHAVGIRARLQTPEWATLWANVQAGKVPFYYMGRGSVVDPSVALSQYFETGGSPRIGYSNPKLDKLLAQERQTFDSARRKKTLSEAMSLITEEAPAHFLWRHQMLYGIAKNIDYKPTPSGRIFGEDIRVLR